ncbi:263_t:CDS:1, partial [Ambispora gerdemannii]
SPLCNITPIWWRLDISINIERKALKISLIILKDIAIMNTAQSRGYSPSPKFFSVSDQEMKEMMDHVLEQKKNRAASFGMVKDLTSALVPGYDITLMITFKMIEKLTKFADDDEETLLEQFTERKINRAILKSLVHSMKSEILAIESRIEQMKNTKISPEDRKFEVTSAFHSCQKVLNDFQNEAHLFYQHPLVTAPSLIAFSQLYVSVCTYGVKLHSSYTELAEREKQRLKEVVEAYKINTVRERLEMVKLTQTIKMPHYEGKIKDDMTQLIKTKSFKGALSNLKKHTKSVKLHVVDIVKDGFGYDSKPDELHYWDRTYWSQEQKYMPNYEYPMVVRIAYENYFDNVIEVI